MASEARRIAGYIDNRSVVWESDLVFAEQEIERLREALERLYDWSKDYDVMTPAQNQACEALQQASPSENRDSAESGSQEREV